MVFETLLNEALEALIIMAGMGMFGAVAGGLIMNYMANKSAALAQQNLNNQIAHGIQAITGVNLIDKVDEAIESNKRNQ